MGLSAITLAVFGQTVGFPFVNYDDDAYVYQNVHVVTGVTGKNILWAFTRTHAANWHPLTWLSHMLDCQLYGQWAGGHHLTNVLLHAVTVVMLFLVLRKMTGQFWPSALVAALFAVHPLRAESVAWVAERKDVLSGLFFVLSLWAYARYAQRPDCWRRYAAVVITFALGLMAKPMIVTLPAVLLLLDYWPLKRWDPVAGRIPRRVVLEKLPLFLLAGLSSVVTSYAQTTSMETTTNLPLVWRVGNAVVAYAGYLGHLFWPCDLAVFYPHLCADLPLWQIVAAASVLLAITVGVVMKGKQYPFLLVGWLWYLGMLVPAIGIVQVGAQAMADRYTYLPQIGVCLMLVWGAVEATRERRFFQALWIPAAGVVAVLAVCAWQQTHYWQDSITLWTHALACTRGNRTAHLCYASALDCKGRLAEAEREYLSALELDPKDVRVRTDLADVQARQGKVQAAIASYGKVLEINRKHPEALAGLGLVMADQGKYEEALRWYHQALEIDPKLALGHMGLGSVLVRQGRLKEAIQHYRQALETMPSMADAHSNLGVALAMQGQFGEAIRHCRQAIELQPDIPESYANLANIFAIQRRWDEAAEEYEKALAISPGLNVVRIRLANVIYRQGRVLEAVALTRQAIAQARAAGRNEEAQQIESQLRRYESGEPDRDLAPPRPSRPLGSSS